VSALPSAKEIYPKKAIETKMDKIITLSSPGNLELIFLLLCTH